MCEVQSTVPHPKNKKDSFQELFSYTALKLDIQILAPRSDKYQVSVPLVSLSGFTFFIFITKGLGDIITPNSKLYELLGLNT